MKLDIHVIIMQNRADEVVFLITFSDKYREKGGTWDGETQSSCIVLFQY